MKFIDLTVPLGIATPPWPTYEPLQVKYFKRLAPNGANGMLLTHSNHVGTHLDGEIHFYTPGKEIASLDLDFLVHEGVVVDLSDCTTDYDLYTSKQVEERVEVKEGDILIIHTGYHHYGWDQPTADEIRYMVKHPGPDREFAEWAKKKKLRWIGVDCGSADHPMNTIIRTWMPRQAKEAEAFFRKKFGKSLILGGGIDKREIARGGRAIRRELHAKLPPLLEQGGYIPFLDHSVPPDISYRDFLHYMELKLTLLGRG